MSSVKQTIAGLSPEIGIDYDNLKVLIQDSLLRERLIGAHSRVMIHVARFGHPHHRMQQKRAIHRLRRAFGQFFVSSV